MMKRALKIFLIAALLPLLSFAVFGEIGTDEYKKTVGGDLFSSFDSETKEALELFGIDKIETDIFDFSVKSLSDYFTTNLKDRVNSAIKPFFEFLSVLMIISVIETLCGKSEKGGVLSLLGVCVLSLLTAQKTYGILNIAITGAQAVNKLMVSFVPIYAGIVAVSGNPASAATYNSLTLFFAEGVSLFASKILVPFVGVILCLTIAFSMSGVFDCGRFLSAAGKAANFSLGAAAAFFTGFLTLKNVLSFAADSAGTRTVRFLVGNLIPVVGSAMSDAYSAFSSSINLIKGSVAGIGILAVVLCCLPGITELLLNFASLSLLSFVSSLFGQNGASSLFRGFSLAIKILLLVLVYEVFIVIISTGLMLSVKGGG